MAADTDLTIPPCPNEIDGELDAPALRSLYLLTMHVLTDVHALAAELAELRATVGRLEQEFGPLARRYGKLTAAAAALPGAGFRRGSRA